MAWPLIAAAAVSALSGLKGASEQKKGAQQAGALASQQYGLARQDLAPYRALGSGAADILGMLQGTYQAPGPGGPGVGGSGLNAADWNAIAPIWSQIRPAGRFEDINWGAIGMPGGPPVSEQGRQFLSSNWGNIRPAGNLGDVDWNAFTQAPSSAPGVSPNAATTGPQGGAQAPMQNWGAFFNSPEYGFNVSEGQKAIERMQGAGAGGLSGAGTKEALRFSSGLASQQVGSFVDRLLASAGLGASSAGQGAAIGANAAAQQGQASMAAGDARASGYGAVGNAAIGGVSDILLNKYLGGGGQGGGMSSYGGGGNPGIGANIGPRGTLAGMGGGGGFRAYPDWLAPGLGLPPRGPYG